MTSDPATPSLRDPLTAAGLGRLAPTLEALAAPSLRLKTRAADDQQLALGVTKLGGLPDLPAGTAWPAWNGVPLGFVAQIHLDELRAYPVAPALPVNGWLYFFYDGRQQAFGDKPGDRGAWQVIYQPAGALALARQAAPPGLPDESRFKPCAVDYAAETTLPQRPLVFAPKLDWTPDEQHRYEDFLDQRVTDRGTPRHRLLGQADEIQDDMHLQCQLLSHGVTDDQASGAAALAAGTLNWQLLLQVDSDDRAAMQWGSAGRLYFWIEQAALQARRFDNVWLVMQSD
jgi:Domain of unknown function (DUF1963)